MINHQLFYNLLYSNINSVALISAQSNNITKDLAIHEA
ncbi:hypothetical protein BPUTSESOX_145 [uncultured Gammaproteobacteria bacterium]|nr:hypothetical protein [uncultured Gammaproteobacteria bacterium]CAC9585299.1 hypothetical protein [uncultured Gammaproteobacteria bacterium]CAC9640405.1 hypothetical protein [uncultured Gammaproteobacteria bacterium]VVH50442.1 hypothetical protein BPUTSESOX_145 [uncultured Gammaproteobacteria bacterium]